MKSILKEHFTGSPIIYDIGCHDGTDTLEFLEVFPAAQIYAFEGDERSIELFKKNVNDGRVTLIEKYLSNSYEVKPLYRSNSETRRRGDEDFWSASTSLKKPKKHLEIFEDVYFEPMLAQTDTLDKIRVHNDMRYPNIVWIDVNGAERDVIEGGIETINEAELIVVEFEEVELFEGSMTQQETLAMLPNFESVGVYDFHGNFGNLLLRKKK